MKVEIDQSIKIEQTNKDTIIGLSNDKTFTVLIKRQVKRKLQEEFRRKGKPRLFVCRTFIAGVVLLLKYAQLKNLSRITIDIEYRGQEKLLKSIFLEMWSRYFEEIPDIEFRGIGRGSRAHNISYLTMKGRCKADKEIALDTIRRLVLK